MSAKLFVQWSSGHENDPRAIQQTTHDRLDLLPGHGCTILSVQLCRCIHGLRFPQACVMGISQTKWKCKDVFHAFDAFTVLNVFNVFVIFVVLYILKTYIIRN